MTRRLYYDDSHLRTFSATVTGVRRADDRIEVSLDATAFYPGGGGQPPDHGRLGARDVVDASEDGGRVWHRIEGTLDEGARVEGEIAWPRRLDHMQQHTGQHVLSRAFVEVAGADTRSFHLGEQAVTIDVEHPGPDDALLRKVEDRANQIVWEDRPVRAHWVTMEEALRFPLRKAPQVEGEVRVVEVDGYDWSACGGTHVARTGEIGVIALLGTERYKGGTRVSFVCGGRAVRRLRETGDLLRRVCLEFTAGEGDLIRAVSRLKEERDSLDRRIKPLVREALEREAAALLAEAVEGPGVRVVARHFPGRDPDEVGTLAAIVASAGGVALLVSGEGASPRAHFCAPPGTISAAALMGDVSRRHGGRGGGRPESAQGTIPADRVEAALRDALEVVTAGTGKGQNA
ncbi:MAG TPA: alanyl-tRNA editing protein [Candidatus Eisenbacteria bacterium]|nr:alanyl-tRNA editing protein [Candidatus Eisenbacteria bacterium]